MKIDAFLTPFFPEVENQFENCAVIMIDVLRASTTICAALTNGAKEIVPTDSYEKAVKIYSSLSKEFRFIGGEKNGLKPENFDAGNSPLEYTKDAIEKKNLIFCTTNGTKLFQKAKQAKIRLVGGFVNISAVIDRIEKSYIDDAESAQITVLCAGTNGRLSYEDTLCAGAYIDRFKRAYGEVELTDSADAAKNLYNLHSADLPQFIKTREHACLLQELGFEKDIEEALSVDKYPVAPEIDGGIILNKEK